MKYVFTAAWNGEYDEGHIDIGIFTTEKAAREACELHAARSGYKPKKYKWLEGPGPSFMGRKTGGDQWVVAMRKVHVKAVIDDE